MSSPYDNKNAEDYLTNTKAIEDGLRWIEKNVDKLPLSKISKTTLSKRTGLHRNTLNDRGPWITDRIDRIKTLKTSAPKEIQSLPSKEATLLQKIEELEESLKLQRQETARVFFRNEETKKQLEESKSVLDQLAKKNILLQEDNESLLKRIAANVTSISARKDPNRRS